MADRPVIAIVDDEPQALAMLLEAVQRRFGADYRVAPYLEGRTALEDLAHIKSRGEDVALVIADQWMPEMSGREVLERMRSVDPLAKRALLVPWGDRSASPEILQGCAYGQLDYYLTKPWSPPEVHLYPAITEFLAEWTRAYRPSLEIVKVIGSDPGARTLEVRALLTRSGIPHGFYPATGAEGQRLLDEKGIARDQLPVIVLADGSALVNPTNVQITDLLAEPGPTELECDLVVVGAGPAGLAAAVYGPSEGLHTVVVERDAIGGQAGASSLIRNYLGFPRGISGAELAQRAYQQAWLFGAKYILARDVTALRASGTQRILTLSDGREVTARAVVIATGARYRRLGIPRLEALVGAGVYYYTFDARLTRGQEVYVAGGGNSAGQAAVHLARHARRVTLVVRASALGKQMSDYLVQQIRQTENIDVRLGCEIIGGDGENRLESLTIRDPTGAVETVQANMLFALIGATPHTDWLAGTVERDDRGFILTGRDVSEEAWPLARRPKRYETSMPGVFAAGDVRHASSKRVASAVGEGSVAVQYVHEYLGDESGLPTDRDRVPVPGATANVAMPPSPVPESSPAASAP